jgi:hypothetical protein
MEHREHLTKEGLKKILSIKAVLNNGLSDQLKAYFPNIVPVLRPLVKDQTIPDSHWVSGFVDGEGCFHIGFKTSSNKIGGLVKIRFLVSQHIRDAEILKNLGNYLGCGKFYKKSSESSYGEFVVTKFNDIKYIIVPFFMKYPLQGEKNQDFLCFKKTVELMENNNSSLTKESFEYIKQMVSRKKSKVAIQSSHNFTNKTIGKRSYSTTRILYSIDLNDSSIKKFNE